MPRFKPFPDGVHTSKAGGLLMAHDDFDGYTRPHGVSALTIDMHAKMALG